MEKPLKATDRDRVPKGQGEEGEETKTLCRKKKRGIPAKREEKKGKHEGNSKPYITTGMGCLEMG